MLLQILDVLKDEIRSGTPVVGLEPSCVAVFRDEMRSFFPLNKNVKRLKKQTCTLAEFLEEKLDNYKVPTLKRKVMMQGHCHQKAIMKIKSEEKICKEMGMNVEM